MDLRFIVDHGGPLVWPLLLLSVVATAAILERLVYFLGGGGRVGGPEPQEWLAGRAASAPGPDERRRLRRSAGGRLLLLGAARARGEVTGDKYDRGVRREFGLLQGKLLLLDAVTAAAPLVGILGTVLGLVVGFVQPAAAAGSVDTGRLAEGVAQALITTVLGLVVAIPTLLARFALGARASASCAALEDYLERLEAALAAGERQ